jgi:hypothetical protein
MRLKDSTTLVVEVPKSGDVAMAPQRRFGLC